MFKPDQLELLADISASMISDWRMFKEYITDYYKNPKDYSILKSSKYYRVIKKTYNNMYIAFEEYKQYFEEPKVKEITIKELEEHFGTKIKIVE